MTQLLAARVLSDMLAWLLQHRSSASLRLVCACDLHNLS